MHNRVFVLLALLALACSASVASAAPQAQGQTVDQMSVSTLGDDIHASAVSIRVGQSYNAWWTWLRNGVPLKGAYIRLQRSYNGGSWTNVDSGYTNSYGRVGWSITPRVCGTHRYRTVYNGVASSILTLLTYGCGGGCPVLSFSAYPRVGTRSTNFKFVGSSTGIATPTSWYWTFGDGKSAYGKTVYHRYATTGYKTVKLTVKSSGGTTRWVTGYNWIRVS